MEQGEYKTLLPLQLQDFSQSGEFIHYTFVLLPFTPDLELNLG